MENRKEKLTEIISNTVVNAHGTKLGEVFHPEFVENIVENLIKNGAEIVTHCCECKHCDHCYPAKSQGRKSLEGWHCGIYLGYVRANDYCSYGERKGGEG